MRELNLWVILIDVEISENSPQHRKHRSKRAQSK